MKLLGAALLLAVTAGCSGTKSDEPNVASNDPIVSGAIASAYPEAGTLDIDVSTNGSYACSATLIAPKVVLTAGHCVDGHKTWTFKASGQVRTSTHATTYDWHESGASAVNPMHHDIGLVFLDAVLTLSTYPTIGRNKLADGSKITNVGRVKDGTLTNEMYSADSLVSDGTSSGYGFDYISSVVIQPGDSGGPDFAFGTHVISSVNSGAGSQVEVLARTDLLYDWIQEQVGAHTDVASCIAEVEPNDGFANAQAISPLGVCGKLDSASDQDWYSTTFGPGSVTVDLTGDGDATFAVGQASGTSCVISFSGLRSISLTTPDTKTVCFRVTGTSEQAYAFTRR